jgi:hypothetical protein
MDRFSVIVKPNPAGNPGWTDAAVSDELGRRTNARSTR